MKTISRWLSVFVVLVLVVVSGVGCTEGVTGRKTDSVGPAAPSVETRLQSVAQATQAEATRLGAQVQELGARVGALEAKASTQSATIATLGNAVVLNKAEAQAAARSARNRGNLAIGLAFILVGLVGALVRHTAMPVNPVPALKKVVTRKGRDLRPADRTFSDQDLNKVPAAPAADMSAHPAGATAAPGKAADPLQELAGGEVPTSLGEPGLVTT